MNSTRLQLLILVSAAQLMNSCRHASAMTHDASLKNPSYSSTLHILQTRADGRLDENPSLAWTGSGTGDVEDESSATEMNYQAKQNVTLSERGRRHREDDAPIKSLLGNAVGLGILGGSDDEDNGEMVFKGGWATYFTQNMIPGACGKVHQDSDIIVAIDYRRYGALNKVSRYCGKKVSITSGHTTITATVADACPTCLNRNCLDLSEGAFKKLGITVEEGMKPITWKFID
ncbi:hypothetical protein PCANC_16663 [Puccinia coronata f. sp. avenae]|uniref:RlpA-like protein double-psi beta-barrel domain-containing protein n=1 Tax=Puccinia coronata f. sp. avenae TaxID=200324 RepID=A0A2N5V580_9BASI|nr:hypothetical protein PCANC_16663 [Puccinia coronata f. sp. avenae]PLW45154.1 hypothetical protein PCASD_04564 [Puccinia coronata f. sp. avenae]